ncbi:MAG: autotransporter-associated beta strand repeat-containing protein [Kiritimatiellae bacterium]|nr:autotransporter-associated beta strand repeat-containing protein [Kiritimatiellia bacterium]
MTGLVLMVALLAAQAGLGTDYTWTGAVDRDWNTADNWSPAGVPTGGDTALFTKAVDIASDISLGESGENLTIGSQGASPAYVVKLSGVISGKGGLVMRAGAQGSVKTTINIANAANTFEGSFTCSSALGSGIVRLSTLARKGVACSVGVNAGSDADHPLSFQGLGDVYVDTTGCETDRTIAGGPSFYVESPKVFTFLEDAALSGNWTFRGYGTAHVYCPLSSAITKLGRTDAGFVYLHNDDNQMTVNLGFSAGHFMVPSVADKGEVCSIGKGTQISMGQTYGTDAFFSYTGSDDADTDRNFSLTYPTLAQANNTFYGKNYDAITCETPGTTLTLNGDILLANPDLASFPNLRFGGAGNGVVTKGIGGAAIQVWKEGNGTWTFAGENTYGGGTMVRGGRLDVNGSTPALASGDSVTVNAGGTLGGNGQVGGRVRVKADGVLAAGTADETGVLTVGDLQLENGAVLLLKVEAAASPAVCDSITVLGNCAIGGGVLVRLVAKDGGAVPSGEYPIFFAAGVDASLFAFTGDVAGSFKMVDGVLVACPVGTSASLTWRGDVANNVWDFTTKNWNGQAFSSSAAVTFDDSGEASVPVAITGDVDPNLVTVNAAKDYTFSGSGKITGLGKLEKRGSGTLTIANANDYTGPTVVAAGKLAIAPGGSLSGTSITVERDAAFEGAGAIAGENLVLTFKTQNVSLSDANTFSGIVNWDFTGYTDTADKYIHLGSDGQLGNASKVTVQMPTSSKVFFAITNAFTVKPSVDLEFIKNGSSKNFEFDCRNADKTQKAAGPIGWGGNIRAVGTSGLLYMEFYPNQNMSVGTPEAVGETEFSGITYVSLRGGRVYDFYSRIDCPGCTFSPNDGAVVSLHATNATLDVLSTSYGTLLCHTNYAIAPTVQVTFGKNGLAYDHIHSSYFDLNGTTQRVARIQEGYIHGGGERKIFTAVDKPATLIVAAEASDSAFGSVGRYTSQNGDNKPPYIYIEGEAPAGARVYAHDAWIDGPLTLVKEGPRTLSLNVSTNAFTGDVIVHAGTLAANAPWSLGMGTGEVPGDGLGDKNLVVDGGVLQLNAAQLGVTNATMRIAAADGSQGMVHLPAGVNQEVRYLWFGEKYMHAGVYGSAESSAANKCACFTGTGTLVVKSGYCGTLLIFR